MCDVCRRIQHCADVRAHRFCDSGVMGTDWRGAAPSREAAQQERRGPKSRVLVRLRGLHLVLATMIGMLALVVTPRLQHSGAATPALAACANAADVQLEADYIVASQYVKKNDRASGAINNVFGAPTWVVPRENAMAILGLVRASDCLGASSYRQRAQQAADYLVRMQASDGSWYDQYSYAAPVVLSKSPTQTAEVMLALDRLGFSRSWYAAMMGGADFLVRLQDPTNKGGADDGLLGGGLDSNGSYLRWRWTSDNSYGYQALKAAEKWARTQGDAVRANRYAAASGRILNGINTRLKDPGSPVWYGAIDENGVSTLTEHEWINYAPQMLDVPAAGVGAAVGSWIQAHLVNAATGAAVWNDGSEADRLSPGYSFQACLVWLDTGQQTYCSSTSSWAAGSGLHQVTPDGNGVRGGWVDWVETGGASAPSWQRFIDSSAYYILATTGGYRFAP